MNHEPDKTTVAEKPTSYQPPQAELEEDVSINATPEAVAHCIGRTVATTKQKPD